jgi:flagellar L-ring protein precursor FlgH
MKIRELILIGFLFLFTLTQSGCASFNKRLKGLLGGGTKVEDAQAKSASNLTKYSDTAEVQPSVKRQYKRTTKQSLSEESALDAKAGSLWVMEGQGAYLFSQNVVRLVGDPLAVQLEGDPKDQLQSKATIIKKLLAKIEERQNRLREPAAESSENKEAKAEKSDKEKDTKKEKSEKTAQAPSTLDSAYDLAVKTVPTRITERTLDGNYRVKGSQPFIIGTREYKIIVTGVVRAEDFNEDGIAASKLLEPKFDIVSARSKETL